MFSNSNEVKKSNYIFISTIAYDKIGSLQLKFGNFIGIYFSIFN